MDGNRIIRHNVGYTINLQDMSLTHGAMQKRFLNKDRHQAHREILEICWFVETDSVALLGERLAWQTGAG